MDIIKTKNTIVIHISDEMEFDLHVQAIELIELKNFPICQDVYDKVCNFISHEFNGYGFEINVYEHKRIEQGWSSLIAHIEDHIELNNLSRKGQELYNDVLNAVKQHNEGKCNHHGQ